MTEKLWMTSGLLDHKDQKGSKRQGEEKDEVEEEGIPGPIDPNVETVMHTAHLSQKEAQDALDKSDVDMIRSFSSPPRTGGERLTHNRADDQADAILTFGKYDVEVKTTGRA